MILTAGSGPGLAAEKSSEIEIKASGYYQTAKGLADSEDLRLAVAWRLAYEDKTGRLQAAEADYTREKTRADNLARGRKKQEARLLAGVLGALAGGLLVGGLVGGLAAWSGSK